MAEPSEIVASYLAAWNEPAETERRSLLERSWADDATYADPTAEVIGRESLVAHIAGVHEQFPGARIRMTSAIDSHHGRIRFSWTMDGPDGSALASGVDFGVIADDGRLARITGFFGP